MPTGFCRIAIVNRGEPARRLIHAVRELNAECNARLDAELDGGRARRPFETIAFYTDPDAGSAFVREATQAFCLGPATYVDEAGQRKSSYLDYARLEHALRHTGAEAAWVGWGFVSEHAAFAELCRRLGVVFIGPPPEAMTALGDKIASKRLAEAAGVPVSPWSGGPVATLDDATAHAERIGFPLVVKATAGGGGRGIRKVFESSALADAYQSAQSEAAKAFGDGTVFLEKMITAARHIEVQVIADGHGTVWAAGVRDCSVQRRHQKVIEEAPCPVLSREREQVVRAASIRLAKAAGYVNAGTAEFLFDEQSGDFYFMEMNTRLQVEHPVTELTTGLDLVKLQLHIAAGGRLEGSPPVTTGHAIEVRLNAEDPDNDFAPAPGKLELFRLPTGPGLRIDTGVAEGDSVAPEFDSMIAKIIAHGSTRAEALSRLRRALAEATVVLRGGTSNRAFLLELLALPDVAKGKVHIAWLDRYVASRASERPFAEIAVISAALDVYAVELALARAHFVASTVRGRPDARSDAGVEVELRYQGEAYALEVRQTDSGEYSVRVEGQTHAVQLSRQGPFESCLTHAGRRHRIVSSVHGLTSLLEVDGVLHRVSRDEGGVLRAPAPALVIAVNVMAGAEVTAGQVVLVLEAMKTEMPVRAPIAGRVRAVLVTPNTQVTAGSPLLALETTSAAADATAKHRLRFLVTTSPARPHGDGDKRLRLMAVLEDIRRLLLGFDVPLPEARHLKATLRNDVASDAELVALKERILGIFVDLVTLYHRTSAPAQHGVLSEPAVSSQEVLITFVRTLDARSLPEPFVATLGRAVAEHGVTALDGSPALIEALLRLHRGHRRLETLVDPVLDILRRPWQDPQALPAHAYSSSFKAILDRVIDATVDSHPVLSDTARQIRYSCFDKPLVEASQARSYAKLRIGMLQLAAEPDRGDSEELMHQLVRSSQPLLGFLSSWLEGADPAMQNLVLEIFVRRFYGGIRNLEGLRLSSVGGFSLCVADCAVEQKSTQVVAAHAAYADLSRAFGALEGVIAAAPAEREILLDVIVSHYAEKASEGELSESLRAAIDAQRLPSRVVQISFSFVDPARQHASHTFTFGRVDGRADERRLYRGIHPMMAGRLELWRLRNFETERLLPSPEDLYVLRSVARTNPKDERLFGFASVRDLTPIRDAHGKVVQLPQLEHLFLETLAIMRQYMFDHPQKHLPWNRVVLNVWPPALLEVTDLQAILARLAPATRNLGLEKVVIMMRVRDSESGGLVPRVLHLSVDSGIIVRQRLSVPTDQPIRELTPYTQRVVQLRRRGMAYPYEIVRMLAAESHGERTVLPPGRFQELELTEAGQLEPVARPYGQNQANIVLGWIHSFTPKHQEGMRRIILLGDPSRDMGALAEPECRRIIAALDLAARERVPLEWFPVSSGAAISMDSGTENLDWTARVLRKLIEFTQAGGEVNLVVNGVNVGAQSYWNAEATMLMHTKGILIMTPAGSLVLTGKKALEYSGGVSADDHQGIGGLERIMGPNGQAQYAARDLTDACRILLAHYDYTYVAPGERFPRSRPTGDPSDRDVTTVRYHGGEERAFATIGEIFSSDKNPGRKKPFDIRQVMRATIDQDHAPLERWAMMRQAEVAVVWDAYLGGTPVALIGVESRPLTRAGFVPGDGPESWTGGTLFPLSSKKVARAINAASGNRPVVVLANLSGFDGSPESMRKLQLEYGAEIGRAVVNFDGPMIFCVISRYHGGAYVVFSRALNDNLEVAALEGAYASVIGGAPAAAVVFAHDVKARTHADPRVKAIEAELARASEADRGEAQARFTEVLRATHVEKLAELADRFDRVHSVERAQRVGSLQHILPPAQLRPYLIAALERGMKRFISGGRRLSLGRERP